MTIPLTADRHPMIVKNIVWLDEAATESFARALAGRRRAIGTALIELQGDLGSGKTTFVRHLLASLGVRGRIKSPTYAVVEPYTLSASTLDSGHNPAMSIWHFDFYRFDDAREWDDAGFRELFAQPGLKLCEWPERAEGRLPPADLHLHIEALEGDVRRVAVEAGSVRGQELLF